MEIYDGWKSPRKFFVFRKTSIHDKIFISAHSPFLDEAKDTIFILVACPGETWQPKKCLWLTGFSKGPNTVRSYVTLFLVFLGFSLLFILYNASGLLYYLLFTYIRCYDRCHDEVIIKPHQNIVMVRASQSTTHSSSRRFWWWERYAKITVFFRFAQNGDSGVFGWTLRAQKWKSPWNIYIFERS